MASPGEHRKTFGQKARKQLGRVTLCAAFTGAVAVAGTGMPVNRAAAPPPPPDGIVQTLAPNPSPLPMPMPAPMPSAAIVAFRRADRPLALRDTPITLMLQTPGAAAAPPVNNAAPQANDAAPPVNNATPLANNAAPAAIITPSKLVEDTMTPEACAPNTDLAAITQNTPEISRALAIMVQLPLTGQGVYGMLQDPANHITSCLEPAPAGESRESDFEGARARISRGGGTSSAFHEYFHAWQSVREGDNDMYSLTMKDALITNLLKEASAVAYEIAANREAKNHHLAFERSSIRVEKVPGGIETHSTLFASTTPANLAVFNTAYDAAWKQGAALDAQSREAGALQAGGQAVVRRLMNGQDKNWKAVYTRLARGNVNNNADAFREDGTSPGYEAKRQGVFLAEGGVSDRINFVPAEYLGPDAAATIDKCFKDMGYSIEILPAAPPVSPVTPPPSPPSS